MILEDNELDTPDPEAAIVSLSVDTGADPPSEPNKGQWWDVEDECYVDDDLCLVSPLEQKGLAFISAPGQPLSRYYLHVSSLDKINQHGDDVTTGGASDEPASHALLTPLDENVGEESDEASELENDLLLAFEEQGKSSSVAAPSSPRPHL